MNEENVKGKVMIIVSLGFLLLISIKRVFLGGDVDEITHYAEAYRLVQGDVFFKNVLEAQMTSSIPLALILKIWKLFTGGYEGGAIFARIITTILLIILSFFVYRTLKLLNLNKNERFILAAIVYLYLTKKMIIPDYSNMQNWIPILIFLFLIQYYFKTFNLSWLICSSVFYSLLVLSWPSYILMLLIFVPFIIIMNVKLSRDKQKIYFDLCVFGGGCIVCAVAFLCYLLQYQSIDELIENIQEMRNISGYSISFGEKIFFWIRSLKVEKSFLFINIITFILWRFKGRFLHKHEGIHYIEILIFVDLLWEALSAIKNCTDWNLRYIPLLIFAGLFYAKKKPDYKHFEICIISGIIALISTLILSVVSVTTAYRAMFCGAFFSLVFFMKEKSKSWKCLTLLIFFYISACSAIFIRTSGGPNAIFTYKCKQIEEGIMKGVYMEQVEYDNYNKVYELTQKYVNKGDRLCYFGMNNAVYMIDEKHIKVATPSIVYNDWNKGNSFIEYFNKRPDILPNIIILEKKYPASNNYTIDVSSAMDKSILSWITTSYNCIYDDGNIEIYK